MKYIPLAATALILSGLPTMAIAQDDEPVSKEEYNELKKEVEELKAMIRLLTEQSGKAVESNQSQPTRPAARPAPRTAPQPASSGETATEGESPTTINLRNQVQRANRRIDALEQKSIELDSAESAFHITGFALTRFNVPDGGDTVFNTSFSPVVLWQINDKLFFESEFEFELQTADGRAETDIALGYANLQFLVNDNLTVGVGKFLSPFGQFAERLHPAWINKLPNAPLIRGHEGLAPSSSIGAFVKGVVPFDGQKIVYTVYAINGPTLVDAVRDEEEFGGLDYDGFSSNKAVGGRIGYLPVPQLEFGYSILVGEADSDNGLNAETTVMGLDASYILDTDPGLFDFRFEYVYSTVDDVTYDASGAVGVGPITFNNERDGLYVQAAFRPIHSSSDFFKNVEFVGRYDYLSTPSTAPEGGDIDRWTAGINYWFNSSTVLKLAVDNVEHEGEEARQNVMLMLGVGF